MLAALSTLISHLTRKHMLRNALGSSGRAEDRRTAARMISRAQYITDLQPPCHDLRRSPGNDSIFTVGVGVPKPTNRSLNIYNRHSYEDTFDYLEHFWLVAPSPLIIDIVRSGGVAVPLLLPNTGTTLWLAQEGRLRAAWHTLTSTRPSIESSGLRTARPYADGPRSQVNRPLPLSEHSMKA